LKGQGERGKAKSWRGKTNICAATKGPGSHTERQEQAEGKREGGEEEEEPTRNNPRLDSSG